MLTLAAVVVSAQVSPAPPTLHTVATSAGFSEGSQGFAFPHIGGSDVVFAAYGVKGESLVQQRAGKLVTVVTSAGSTKFSRVESPTSTNEAVAFVGTTHTEGLFMTSYPFSSYETIAEVSSSNGGFGSVQAPSLERSNVAFAGMRASLAGIYAAPASAAAATRTAHTLINASSPQPHRPHSKLRCLMDPSISKAGYVAFFGSDCAGGAGWPLGKRMYRTMLRQSHALHLDGSAGVVAGVYLAALPTEGAAWPAAGEAALTVVADSTTSVPGSSDVTFEGFSSPVASESTVAFVASTSDGAIGIYTYDLATPGSLQKIVDSTTAVPGGAGTFSDFPYAPSIAGSTVVFYAAAGGATSGVYAHTQANGKGAVVRLVTMGDTIDGEPVAFLGAGGASSDAKSATFYAVTNTNGIYTVAI